MKSTAKHLGFWDVFCIAAGAMISSGLFVLPGLAFANAGPAVILSYGLAAILILPALLCQAELTSAIPKAGATFVFIERCLGSGVGMFAGMASWFSMALKSAFALIGIGAFARLIWPDEPEWIMRLIAIGFCIGFTVLNCLTVKGVGRAQIIMVAGLLAVLIGYVGKGFASPLFHVDNFEGFFHKGFIPIIATSGIVFISFGGLTATADIAGEVHRGAKNVPLGMLSALLVVGLLYVACVTVTVGVTTGMELDHNYTPLSLAAEKIAGRAGLIILSFAAMLAFITTANGGILEASRSPLAMSHDGLLPERFGRHSKKFDTPIFSVILTGTFMVLILAGLSIENLVKVASTMLLMQYSLICLAVIVMRSSKLQNYRPLFRIPMGIIFPAIGLIVYPLLIFDMGLIPLLTTVAFALVGLVWYLIYIRPRIQRESAMVYLVKKIVSKNIYRTGLEEELKQIAIERDEVIHDRFDTIIKSAPILDLPEQTTVKVFFNLIAQALAPRLKMSTTDLVEKITAREKETSTIIQPGLAIPHVIVDGENKFEILLARCTKGIIFDPKRPPVHTVFVLTGSADQRNYHLRVLMTIANIVQEPDFIDRWFAAADVEHLRDLVLMSNRKRDHEKF